ncbi:MAG: metallophosphoesterase, partial [Myxococcota bacterium]
SKCWRRAIRSSLTSTRSGLLREFMRLAHFSDIHITLSPVRYGGLWSKRTAGALNYYVGGRRHHFANVEARVAALLADVDAQGVDHAVCTGDITQMSYVEEFRRCAALFGPRLEQPQRFTVIPGNHDRYTSTEADLFEQFFGRLAEPDGRYPFRKDVGAVSFVGLDLARPTALIDSSGLCGPAQLSALTEMLKALTAEDRKTIVLMHYGFFRADGRPDRPRHGIRDAKALLALLDREDLRVDLILHGHIHRSYAVRTARRAVICAGSATDLARGSCYHLYDLDAEGVWMTRRRWNEQAQAYATDGEPVRVLY